MSYRLATKMRYEVQHDAIIVGAGHNALIVAAYLAAAGKRVLVLERNAWIGGGVVTQEVTAPGFKHDLHSSMHLFIAANPLLRDDELGLVSRFGLKYIHSDASYSTVFEDGESITCYRDIDRSCASIARFSARDAQAYRRFAALGQQLIVPAVNAMFVPPRAKGEQLLALDSSPAGREVLATMGKSPYEVACEWFENDRVKIHLLKFASEVLHGPDERGTGMNLFSAAGFVHSYPSSIPEGGSGALCDALARCIVAHGGEIRTGTDVTAITVENGRAMGVGLASGERLRTEGIVVGSIHPRLLGDMLPGVSQDIQTRSARLLRSSFAPFVVHYALNEAPKFTSPNADLARSICIEIVPSDLTVFRRQFDDYRYGRLHTPGAGHCGSQAIMVHTNHDPTRAPGGQGATLYVFTFVPYELAEGGAQRWSSFKESWADTLLTELRGVTINMGPDNIIARHVDSPVDIAARSPSFWNGDTHGIGHLFHQMGSHRPLPELSQYTVPGCSSFYLVGPFMHPGGGVSGGGRAAALRILSDLGLPLPRSVTAPV